MRVFFLQYFKFFSTPVIFFYSILSRCFEWDLDFIFYYDFFYIKLSWCIYFDTELMIDFVKKKKNQFYYLRKIKNVDIKFGTEVKI